MPIPKEQPQKVVEKPKAIPAKLRKKLPPDLTTGTIKDPRFRKKYPCYMEFPDPFGKLIPCPKNPTCDQQGMCRAQKRIMERRG